MIHIELVNDQRVVQTLQRAAAAIENPAPLLQKVGAVLEANARERFDSKTDPAGRLWTDITPLSSSERRDGPLPWCRGFLSCLSGSERFARDDQPHAAFLSCLSGSEPMAARAPGPHRFLSCLSGSELS